MVILYTGLKLRFVFVFKVKVFKSIKEMDEPKMRCDFKPKPW